MYNTEVYKLFFRNSHIIYFLKNILPYAIPLILKQVHAFMCVCKAHVLYSIASTHSVFSLYTLSEYISRFRQVRSDLKLGMTEEEFGYFNFMVQLIVPLFFNCSMVTIILKQKIHRVFHFDFCAVV